jgi:hypothetical protein
LAKIKKIVLVVLLCFVAPALASLAVRAASSQPGSWRAADWSSSGTLPSASQSSEAAVYVMAARTGGLKGALAVHSWIVTKAAGAKRYNRYDKVGWGNPIRTNAYPADGRWYSNAPDILLDLHGTDAGKLIPQIEAAVRDYPYSDRGDYKIWPGPNSNSFIAHILREVPDLDIALPPEAIGRDYRGFGDFVSLSPNWRNLEISLGGYAGFAIGTLYGVELRLGGLVFGIDITRPALKLPGFGRIGMARNAALIS